MHTSKSAVIPTLLYRNAPQAIEWLCKMFGFSEQLVVKSDDGLIAHAQLVYGGGMIMLGSVREPNDFSRWMTQPEDIRGMQTQSIYLMVADADEVYAKVLAAEAKVVVPIKDEDYGGRGFACFDIEGHLWYVGTYDPW